MRGRRKVMALWARLRVHSPRPRQGGSEPRGQRAQALKQCHCVVSCWGAWPWDSSAVDIASTIHRASCDQ